MSNPGYGVAVHPLALGTTLAGPTIGAAVQPGWWLTSHVKIAGELGAGIALGGSDKGLAVRPTSSDSGLPETKINQTLGWQALALIRCSRLQGARLARAGRRRVLARHLPVRTKRHGQLQQHRRAEPRGRWDRRSRVGYDFDARFGLLLRASTARLSNDNSTYRPVSVGMMADFGLF